MGCVSFLSITENVFCRVKGDFSDLQRTLTYFASTFANVTLHGNALLLISRIPGFSRCKTCFGIIFKSALEPIAERHFDVCFSTSSNALPHWNTLHPRTPEILAKTTHSAF